MKVISYGSAQPLLVGTVDDYASLLADYFLRPEMHRNNAHKERKRERWGGKGVESLTRASYE